MRLTFFIRSLWFSWSNDLSCYEDQRTTSPHTEDVYLYPDVSLYNCSVLISITEGRTDVNVIFTSQQHHKVPVVLFLKWLHQNV